MKKIAVSVFLLLTNIETAFAQTTIGGYTIDQPTGLRSEFTQPGALGSIISRIFLFILPIVGILGFLFIMWSGFQYLTSKGDPKALEGAKLRLTYSIVGLVIVFAAYTITVFVTSTFGLLSP